MAFPHLPKLFFACFENRMNGRLPRRMTARFDGRMALNWRAISGRMGRFDVRTEGNAGGFRVVRAFANEDADRRLFAGGNEGYRSTKLGTRRRMAACGAHFWSRAGWWSRGGGALTAACLAGPVAQG